ncbi:AAA family ATPase [Cupriavidus pinatubonensis]|nr:ATP-binding protein [Cupriavidus pinatubonensis]QYY32745.1 AAA family ATPase [Cupriavidus pinatubonensis]
MTMIAELPPERLYTPCEPKSLGFDTTESLVDVDLALIHPRAVAAIQLGIGMRVRGCNLFVLGEPGSGRRALVRHILEAAAPEGPQPEDWCYVCDFAASEGVKLLRLPGGRGRQLFQDMQRFSGEVGLAVAAAFEDVQYQSRVESLEDEEKAREEAALQALGEDARKHGIAMLREPDSLVFAPLKDDAEKTISEEEFARLPEAQQQKLSQGVNAHYEQLQRLMSKLPHWRRNLQKAIREVGHRALRLAVGHLIAEIRPAYADLPAVVAYLDAVLQDAVETGQASYEARRGSEADTSPDAGMTAGQRYVVNLLVENPPDGGRPAVFEANPTLQNLVGRIDHRVHMGTMVSHFTLIRPGALHRANGGFLVIDAAQLLSQPHAWAALKRTQQSGEIRIESLADVVGLGGSAQLQPEPVPVDVKVILIAERSTYDVIAELDPDVLSLFKINAELESEIDRTPESCLHYARLIATLARNDRLRPLSAGAVARVIEHAARLAGDAEKLSTQTQPLCDLLQEADHLAAVADAPLIERAQIEAALDARRARNRRLEEGYREDILRGQLLIDSSGEHVGQVNGLAVIALADATFAHPVRITATVGMGEGEIVDIEREVELGGPIHSKGVLILSSFLAARFGCAMPLSLRATLVFEQSYCGVEGDSASLAELASLLSALSGIPVRQSLAVSGSVNQFGVVQPVSDINEKIEGFFEVCRARGLSGQQGVLIPAANVCHLMLRSAVVEAVQEGRFHIWAVRTIEEAIELLTGVEAGEPDEEGEIPRGSVNYQVAIQLAELARIRQVGLTPPPRPLHRRKPGTRVTRKKRQPR